MRPVLQCKVKDEQTKGWVLSNVQLLVPGGGVAVGNDILEQIMLTAFFPQSSTYTKEFILKAVEALRAQITRKCITALSNARACINCFGSESKLPRGN